MLYRETAGRYRTPLQIRRCCRSENREFKSFFKEVKGNEGEKCRYNIRLDTYGCGCQHNCSYCYARSLLAFRGLWDPVRPRIADIEKIRRKVRRLPEGWNDGLLSTVRVGAADCLSDNTGIKSAGGWIPDCNKIIDCGKTRILGTF